MNFISEGCGDEIVGKEFKYLEVPFKNVVSHGLYATLPRKS